MSAVTEATSLLAQLTDLHSQGRLSPDEVEEHRDALDCALATFLLARHRAEDAVRRAARQTPPPAKTRRGDAGEVAGWPKHAGFRLYQVVRTTKDAGSTDWAEQRHPRWGETGVVRDFSDAHGPLYLVVHQGPEGELAEWYEAGELEAI